MSIIIITNLILIFTKIGQIVNEIKSLLEKEINEKTGVLEKKALADKLANEKVDITLPGRKPAQGHLHPVTLTLREIKKIFMRMGFDVCDGADRVRDRDGALVPARLGGRAHQPEAEE